MSEVPLYPLTGYSSEPGGLFADKLRLWYESVNFHSSATFAPRQLSLLGDDIRERVVCIRARLHLRLNPTPPLCGVGLCRGTLLIRNTPLLGPYSRTIPRVLW